MPMSGSNGVGGARREEGGGKGRDNGIGFYSPHRHILRTDSTESSETSEHWDGAQKQGDRAG